MDPKLGKHRLVGSEDCTPIKGCSLVQAHLISLYHYFNFLFVFKLTSFKVLLHTLISLIDSILWKG